MWKYPIKTDENGYISRKEAHRWCNQSFYDGFIAAHCSTPEEYEAINPVERIALCFEAIERNAVLRRETPPQTGDCQGRHAIRAKRDGEKKKTPAARQRQQEQTKNNSHP